jgi:predicted alpha/beta superfamily hydrolase
MNLTETIDGRECTFYTMDGARTLVLQPVDDHDRALLDSEVALIRSLATVPFNLVAFRISDWMSELTPWPAPPAFGSQPFGYAAEATLRYLSDLLLPALAARFEVQRTILGGYSLAGLFSLWAGYNSSLFHAIAAASPSVWYPQWMEYIAGRELHSQAVYLSLGDREARTKNPIMAHVGDAIRLQHRLLSAQGVVTTIEWNPGGHFVDPDKRIARAFAWTLGKLIN